MGVITKTIWENNPSSDGSIDLFDVPDPDAYGKAISVENISEVDPTAFYDGTLVVENTTNNIYRIYGHTLVQIATGVPASRTIGTTAPITGGGDLSANRTIGITNFAGGAAGAVPASPGGTGTWLRADGTWNGAPYGTVVFPGPSGSLGVNTSTFSIPFGIASYTPPVPAIPHLFVCAYEIVWSAQPTITQIITDVRSGSGTTYGQTLDLRNLQPAVGTLSTVTFSMVGTPTPGTQNIFMAIRLNQVTASGITYTVRNGMLACRPLT